MNILSAFYRHKDGGYNQRLYSLYKALAKEGHCLYYLSSETFPVTHKNIRPCLLPAPFLKKQNAFFWLYFITGSLFKSLEIARKYHIQAIVNFAPFFTFLCILPIKLRRIPAITFIRADNMKHSKKAARNIFYYCVDWAGLKISERIIFNSHKLIEIYQKRYHIPERKISLLPNNITRRYSISQNRRSTFRRSLGVHSNEFLLSTSGTFNQGKNFSYLIEVMEALHKDGIKLLIIGDEVVPNGERERLKRLTSQLGLENSIIFSGWQSDPFHLVASSDLFVFPSRFEGCPNALLEALGCGVPCLGSRIDEIAEVLRYEELLFPLDCHGVLIDKVKRLRCDSDFYYKVKMLSHKRCEHFLFDWDQEVVKVVTQHL